MELYALCDKVTEKQLESDNAKKELIELLCGGPFELVQPFFELSSMPLEAHSLS